MSSKPNYLGYIRVSSKNQHLNRQIVSLTHNGVAKSNIYSDKKSGKNTHRVALQKLLHDVNHTNVVVVTSLDRLGRNSKDIQNIIGIIKRKGATLQVLNLPTFRSVKNANLRGLLTDLVFDIAKYQAQEERKEIRTRQAQGIASAKKNGVYNHSTSHPKFTLDNLYLKRAFKMYSNRDNNCLSVAKIASKNNMSRSTLEKKLRKYNVKDNISHWKNIQLG